MTTSVYRSPLPTLLACAVVGFLFTLSTYIGLGGHNPVARLPFAVFVSVLPAVIAWPVCAWWRLSRQWAIVVYVGVFVLTVLVQAGVR